MLYMFLQLFIDCEERFYIKCSKIGYVENIGKFFIKCGFTFRQFCYLVSAVFGYKVTFRTRLNSMDFHLKKKLHLRKLFFIL